ncbi:MAG: hypothetical protein R3B49_06500 [Phycisphaerales bacterium]
MLLGTVFGVGTGVAQTGRTTRARVVPSLVLHGTEDPVCPIDDGRI